MPERKATLVLLALAMNGCDSGPQFFHDLTEEKDLEFVSYSGDNLWYLIDTLGAGIAAADHDGDGRPDLFLLTGSAITDAFQDEACEYSDALWRNDGDTFRDVTETAGVGSTGWSNGAVFADYDGDGDLDIFVARHGPNLLWRNEGDGRFKEVARAAGVADPRWSLAASFADLDGDGDLDLYVANYSEFDVGEEKGTVNWFTAKQFPSHFEPADNILYRNDGDGTFTDVTAETGAAGTGRSMTILATDYDDDGDVDLFVANDIGENDLYRNDGNMTFENVGLLAGVARDANARKQATMGAAVGDYDNDGDMDIMVTNYGGEYHTLYRNAGGYFEDVTQAANLVHQETLDTVGWGIGLHDFDLDGNLDILSINGHILGGLAHLSFRRPWWLPNWVTGLDDDFEELEDYPQMDPEAFNLPRDQPKHFFLGNGDGTFRDASEEAGDGILDPRMGRGAAFADFDGDGRVDVAVSNKNQSAQVLLNRVPPKGSWIKLDLRAAPPNVFAVGSRITVEAGDRRFTREILAGTSYSSSDDYIVHVGLGETDGPVRARVRWPGGETETFEALRVETTHRLERGGSVQKPAITSQKR